MPFDEAALKKHMPELVVGGAGLLALGVVLLGKKPTAAPVTGSFLPNTLQSNGSAGSGPAPAPGPSPSPAPVPPGPTPLPDPGPIPLPVPGPGGNGQPCPPGFIHGIGGSCVPFIPIPPVPVGGCAPGYHMAHGQCIRDAPPARGHAWWCDGTTWRDGGSPPGCAVYTSENPPAFACDASQRCQGSPEQRPNQGGGGAVASHPIPHPGPDPDPGPQHDARYNYLHRRTHSEWWSYPHAHFHGGPPPNPPSPPDPPGGGPPPMGQGGPGALPHDPGGYRGAAMAHDAVRMAYTKQQMRLFR